MDGILLFVADQLKLLSLAQLNRVCLYQSNVQLHPNSAAAAAFVAVQLSANLLLLRFEVK